MLLDGEAYHKNHKTDRPSQGSPYIQCNPSLNLIRLLMKGAKLISKFILKKKMLENGQDIFGKWIICRGLIYKLLTCL